MNADLITMIGNLSQSLFEVQFLVKGAGYFLGIFLVISGFMKLRKAAESRSSESLYIPVVFLLAGFALLFLPSMVDSMANTVFGVGNVLQYSKYNPYDVYSSVGVLIKTVGLIWFVRGCFLILHPPQQDTNYSTKGLLYLFASVLSINFDNTVYYLTWLAEKVTSLTMTSSVNT